MSEATEALVEDWRDSTRRAFDALARYKFWMFGYHAGRAVYTATLIERLGGPKLANPFRSVVLEARRLYCRACGEMRQEEHLCSAKSLEWQFAFDEWAGAIKALPVPPLHGPVGDDP